MDVSNNPLDSTEFLERLRADWAKQCNLMLPEGVRIDHRSLEAQGIERIPTIHEGHASREITKRGGHSILNAINRRIATANRYLTAIRKQMGDPTGLLGQFKEQARKELDTAIVFCQVVIGQCGVSFPSEKAVGFSPVRNWPVIARVLLFHCIRA